MQPIPLKHLRPLHPPPPPHPILRKLLHPRPQPPLMQRKIIHSPHPQNTHTRKRSTNTIHKRAARRTEIIRHRIIHVSGVHGDGARLGEGFEVGAAAEVGEVGV